ncbi:MAG: glycosyltransferase, partial [Burkholderiaceae bacterium]
MTNPQVYFELADIGLLPSYFVGEAMPLVLLEMMAKSLPLVASNIGEIPCILGTGEDAAGLIVPLSESGIDEDALYA